MHIYCEEIRTASLRFVPLSMNGDQQVFTGSFNDLRDKPANSGQIAGWINATSALTQNSLFLENFAGALPASRVRDLPVITGPAGPAGPQGHAGPSGSMGLPVVLGVKGLPSALGLPGAARAIGPTGPAGAKGDKGDPGATGATGATGPAGMSGGL